MTEDTDTMHPDNFEGKTSVDSTVMLTGSSVLSLPLCLIPNTGAKVHNNRLLDDETIFMEMYRSKHVAFTS
eukprot:14188508-Ditylum_brightwellii.AAC.1